jgi:putative hydrolase of the HAD superfamily
MTTPQFIYFDLGNVVLHFSRSRQYRQMAEILGISAADVGRIAEQHDLMLGCETGQLSPQEVYQTLCKAAGNDCTFAALNHAYCDIFELNISIMPLILDLARCGYRLGILSNTCQSHWEFCRTRFALLEICFEQFVLSYEVGAMKPAPEIYTAAIESTDLSAEKIFYTDDLKANVQGATEAGIDAVLYTDTATLSDALRQRGLEFNF